MSRAVSGLYEFGPFRLNLERRVLTREQQVVPLAPKTFDLLVLLVQSPGRAFSKQELMHALWPETFVEEANLSFQISVLRKALGEDGAGLVETVPKHGYRFSADVRATAPSDKPSAAPLSGAKNEPSSVMLKRSTRKVWLAGATIAAALLVVAAFLTVVRGPRTAVLRTSPALAVPLTAYPGDERAPSLSPDGSRVAFSWNGPTLDNYDIYVKLAGPGEPVRLTTSSARDESPAWSPDGRFIAFIRFTSPNDGCGPGSDPSARRRRKDHFDDFPGADSPQRQADQQSLLDAGRKMACLRRGDITQRLARHLVDLSRWLGAARASPKLREAD